MKLDNGRISERQGFRIGVLENIALGIVVIPYVTVHVAGRMHTSALFVGLLFTCLYAGLMYVYSKCFPEGMIDALNCNLGFAGRLFDAVYVLRYLLRASLIMLFFGTVIHTYMLRTMNIWVLAVPFALICGYGASRDIEKRGRLLEMLFWWMIVPLIIVAVFSISNVDWVNLPEQLFHLAAEEQQENGGTGRMLQAGYLTLLVLSSVELMMYTLQRQVQNNWRNGLKILVWIVIAILLSYAFIIGILGGRWVGSDSVAALNVMEASAFPGGVVERLDYPVLAFWIIGVFAVVSGYMFYAKEYAGKLFSTERTSRRWWIMLVLVALALLFMWGWTKENFAEWMLWYILWLDIGISIFVPLLVYFVRRARAGKTFLLLFVLTAGVFTFTGCGKKYESSSLEERDYVISMSVSGTGNGHNFSFVVADLTEYTGDSKKALKTEEFVCTADSLEEAMRLYYDENERQLDLGHIQEISLEDEEGKQDSSDIILEMSAMPSIAKSTSVLFKADGESRKIILRELIKEVYAGEEF